MNEHHSYHITYAPAKNCCEAWPDGMWSVYRINGDEIASRIIMRKHKVVARHSWPGFVGGFANLALAQAAIEKDIAEQEAWMSKRRA